MKTLFWKLLPLTALFSCGMVGGNTESGADGRLQQTPLVNQVEVITLEKADFAKELLSNGKLSASARASLSFSTSGPLSEVNVRSGQHAGKGSVLARLDRPDLALALESAQITLEKAQMDLFDYLVGQGYPARDTLSVPANLLATAKMKSGYANARNALARARQDVDGTVLRAPFSGRVADVKLRRHDLSGTEPFCTLIDDTAFDVDFTVMESEYGFLSEGLPVTVTPYADGSFSCRGKIVSINPSVDRSGQISVRARVPGDRRLLDGMNVKVTVARMLPGQLVVPRSAVVIRDNLDVLFTYTDDGKAHWTYVNIVASNSTSHVVTANKERGASLSEGDRVIVSGNLNLADGSDVVLSQ